jgi:integrase
MKLTDIGLRALPVPHKGQKLYYDDVLPSFGCRVSQGGTRSFFVQHGADRQFTTIGRYPIISLSDARTEAKRILAERTLGKLRPRSVPWDVALAGFLEHLQTNNKPRTVADYTRLLNRHFDFKKQDIADITADDISRRLDRIHDAPAERNHALVVIKIFLSWAQKPPRRYIERNPSEGMTVARRASRKRVLSDREIATVWNAACRDEPFHHIVRLCIILGQRRGEVGSLRPEYVDWQERTITLPDTKNNRSHTFPFGPMAADILKALPTSGYLFPGRYTTEAAYNGWAKNKRELDVLYATPVAPYTLQDLRRTAATNWAKLGVAPHVVERLLNHTFGSLTNQTDGGVSPIAEVYNRHAYLPEMRAAISLWERRLATILQLPNS